MNIFKIKYGEFKVSNCVKIAKSYELYISLCRTAEILRPHFSINCCNPNSIDFWNDPWCFRIPLAFKPTFINMHYWLKSLSTDNFVSGNALDVQETQLVLGMRLDWCRLSKWVLYYNSQNHWVWFLECFVEKSSKMVYNHLNQSSVHYEHWKGWHLLWKLQVAPRVKLFLWKLFHGRRPTSALCMLLTYDLHYLVYLVV